MAERNTRLSQLCKSLTAGTVYQFGKPWHAKETLAVLIPIIHVGEKLHTRPYVLLEEVQHKVKLKDSGGINTLIIEPKEGAQVQQPIFVRSGTVFEGIGTQSRAVQATKMIIPDTLVEAGKDTVEIRCINHSHGIRSDAKFRISGQSPPNVHYALYSGNQGSVWNEVDSYISAQAMSLNASGISLDSAMGYGQSDNLSRAISSDEYTRYMDKFIREMPALENQVGVIILDSEGVLSMEIFDHPDSWKASSEAVIRKYGDAFTKPAKTAFKIDLDEERMWESVKSFLNSIGSYEYKEDPDKEGTHLLETNDVSGEYTIFRNIFIHMVVLRKTQSSKPKTRTPTGSEPLRGHISTRINMGSDHEGIPMTIR